MIGLRVHPRRALAGTVAGTVLAATVATAAACAPTGDSETNSTRGESTPREAAYADISAEDLQQLLASADPVLINVHVPRNGDIPGTDLGIPYDEIGIRSEEIPGGKNSRIVLYCRSGHMSTQAARTLVSLGYTAVYNLSGGIEAWEARRERPGPTEPEGLRRTVRGPADR